MTILSKVVKMIIRASEWILIGLLAMSIVIIGLQVFFRYVIVSPIPWTEQLARYMFIWMTMLCLPVLFYRGQTMAFTLIFDAMPRILQTIIDTVIIVIALTFVCYYSWHSLQYCIETGDRLAAGLRIPINLVYAAQPVGGFILSLVLLDQGVNKLIEFIKRCRGRERRDINAD